MPNQTCVFLCPIPKPVQGTKEIPRRAIPKTSVQSSIQHDCGSGKSVFPLVVKTIIFQSGERFPVLLQRENGMPMLAPTVYLTSIPRMRGNQTATLTTRLGAIRFLYLWGLQRGIDIEARFRDKDFLRSNEVEDFVLSAFYPIETLLPYQEVAKNSVGKLAFLHTASGNNQNGWKQLDVHTVAVRIYYASQYLDWLSERVLTELPSGSAEHARLQDARVRMMKALEARTPSEPEYAPKFNKMGIDEKTERVLLNAIGFDSPNNPWSDERVKSRNEALIKLLLLTGMRRGEALGLRVSDLDLEAKSITIHRTPNDPDDPRRNKPQTKTRARVLLMDADLVAPIRKYILSFRHKGLPAARRTPFLFVGVKTGKPLSISALNRIFETLREKVPGLPDDFSAHILRHTWNDRFSKKADQKRQAGIWDDAMETTRRNELMGWVPHSEMAGHYTHRHTSESANEVLLEMQNEILNGGKEDNHHE